MDLCRGRQGGPRRGERAARAQVARARRRPRRVDRRGRGRCRAPAAGGLEPAHQRDQVQRPSAGTSASPWTTVNGRARHQGERQRGRDRARLLAARLQSLFPGGHLQHARVRRAGPRPGDRAPPRRAARRDDGGRQPGPGKGATFTVTLPLMNAASAWPRAVGPSSSRRERRTARATTASSRTCACWSWTTTPRRGRR